MKHTAWGALRAVGAALAAAVALAGCATGGSLIAPSLSSSAYRTLELSETPFHPQRRFQCGPAALATVLQASGIAVAPDELTPLVYLPARRGSLQVEMVAATRRMGRLPYVLDPNLDAILEELAARRPVLVLHNYGLPFLPRWHYAVVIGYDAEADALLLRSGTTARQTMGARHFMRAWDNADRWAMVALRPGELPAKARPAQYLESAAAFERVASPDSAAAVFAAAAQRWPEEPVAWIGWGTAEYRRSAFAQAAQKYRAALRIAPTHAAARNNLAMSLLEQGCVSRAREELASIQTDGQPEHLLQAIEDTRAQIESRASDSPEPPHCAKEPVDAALNR